jgi:hypothetical protein
MAVSSGLPKTLVAFGRLESAEDERQIHLADHNDSSAE